MSEQLVSLAPESISDPTKYAELREKGPLVHVSLHGLDTPVWLVTGYEDAKDALTDPRFVRDATKLAGQEGPSIADQMIAAYGLPAEYAQYLGILVLADGEEHARVRNLLVRSFTARRVNALRPQLEKVTEDLYTALKAKGEADLVGEFGYAIAATAICELMGVDAADQPTVQGFIQGYASGDPEHFIPAIQGIVEFCKALIAKRTAEPGEDLVSGLLQDEGDEKLTETEIIAVFLLLINTGIAPPAHFLSEAVLALFDHPEQLAKLRAEPELLATTAVPELLRFASAVPMGAPLYATEDLEFKGCPIKAGEVVNASLKGANHDPAEYEEPTALDVTRKLGSGVGHVALGHGPHYCIGAALAKLETEIVLNQLLIKHEGLSLAVDREDLVYAPVPGEGMHLTGLPVRF
ncbi:cytochrome P450 [Streptomyces lasiicapitis]|uniref:Cytochrome P450 n=1 Tax=Streptomyces lasiicapitis TaxID=1923961 RepID=A0ABQ2LJ69_9ACTN|nr:cytochrome P450 [Streptomyces lasiicapitis]GGO36660.1 cytochrome P450 [Streptomyces lasiicapitis]